MGTEARRLLKHGNTDATLFRWVTAWAQEIGGGARAGAAVQTPTGGAAGIKGPRNGVDAAAVKPDAGAGGKPVTGLCSEHQGHCMPMSAAGALSVSIATGSAWIQTMPLALQICIQSLRSDPATAACARVGRSAANTRASMASQAVKRRWTRVNGMVCSLSVR